MRTHLGSTRFELTTFRHRIAWRSPLMFEWMANRRGTDSKVLTSCFGVKFSGKVLQSATYELVEA